MKKVRKKEKFTKAGILGYFLKGCYALFAASIVASIVTTV